MKSYPCKVATGAKSKTTYSPFLKPSKKIRGGPPVLKKIKKRTA